MTPMAWSTRARTLDRLRLTSRCLAKGWKLAPDGDVRVAANVTSAQKQDYTTYYSGMGYGWGWGPVGPGMATASVYTYGVVR